MKTFKDWKPGECRVKIEVLSPKGTVLDAYLPHLSEMQGMGFIALMNEAMHSEKDPTSEETFREIVKLCNDKGWINYDLDNCK